MKTRIIMLFILVFFLTYSAYLQAQQPLKVICASRAEQPLVIDGKLDEPCWKNTEACHDFVTPAGETIPVKQTTIMRVVYDNSAIYIGLDFHWNNIEDLKKGIQEIIDQYGTPSKYTFANIKKYANRFGAELFIDPGASRRNYYQILINAAGQMTGHYKMNWGLFKNKPFFKSAITGDRWTAEFVFPYKNLKTGSEWGLNICRNDQTYYGIWKQMGSDYNNPKRFGKMLIGDYQNWWKAVWAKNGVETINKISAKVAEYSKENQEMGILYDNIRKKVDKLGQLVKIHPPINRKNFKIIYVAYQDFKSDFDRFNSLYKTRSLME